MNRQAEKFLSTLARSKNTVKSYRQSLEVYFKIAGTKLDDQVYEQFWNDPRIQDYSDSTKRLIASAVMGLYAYCRVGDILARKAINDHYLARSHNKRVDFKYKRIESVEKVVKHCEGLKKGLIELRDRAFVLMLADAGFRISELVNLRRDDIDFDRECVIVTGKGGKTAVIRLSRRSLDALGDYLKKRQKMDGKTGKPLGSLPLFAQHGRINFTKAMTVDGMRKSVKERMQEVEVDVRIHDFRHYFVTKVLLESNGNLKLAQELARHESVSTTQRYSHLSDDYLDENYDRIFNKEAR